MEPSTFEKLLATDETFYPRESRRLAALAARMKVPPSDIEDVVQEAWKSVVEHSEQFVGVDVERRVQGWLRQVVHGKAVDLLRHLGCCPCQALAAEGIELIDEAEAQRAEAAEWGEWLRAMLVKVCLGNEEGLYLLCAHFFHRRSLQELADERDTTVKSIDCRIRRLLHQLREAVEHALHSGEAAPRTRCREKCRKKIEKNRNRREENGLLKRLF